jgi:hypothetical protein
MMIKHLPLLAVALIVSLTASAQNTNEFHCRPVKTPRMLTFHFQRQSRNQILDDEEFQQFTPLSVLLWRVANPFAQNAKEPSLSGEGMGHPSTRWARYYSYLRFYCFHHTGGSGSFGTWSHLNARPISGANSWVRF